MRDSAELVRFFIESLLTRRDVKAAVSCLSDDILCIGTDPMNLCRGLPAASAFISELVRSIAVPYRISFHEMEKHLKQDGSGYIFAGMEAYPGTSRFSTYLRLSATVRNEFGASHICFFHMSIPKKLSVNSRPESMLDNVPCGVAVFRLSPKGMETIFMNRSVLRYFAIDMGEDNDLKNLDWMGRVHPDDRQNLNDLLYRSSRISTILTDSFRIKRADGEYRWINMHFSSTSEGEQSQIMYVTLNDTEDMRLIEGKQRFYDDLSYRTALAPDLITSLLVDLSSGDISEINGPASVSGNSVIPVSLDECDGNYDRYLELFSKKIPGSSTSETFTRIFCRSSLLQELEAGHMSITHDFIARRSDGIATWISCTVNMIRRPLTEASAGFFVIRDITRDRINELIIKKIIEKQYDMTCIINGDLNTYRVVSSFSLLDSILPESGADYEERMTSLISSYSSLGPADPMIEALRTLNIRSALLKSDTVSHFGTFVLTDG